MSKENYLLKCPIDGSVLSEIDYSRIALAKLINEKKEDISRISDLSNKLDDYEAAELGVLISVHNVKQTTLAISNYLGIVEMLLSNLRDDMQNIYEKRDEFMRKLVGEFEAMQKAKAQEDFAAHKREQSKLRMQKKRAADKAAGNQITNQ